MGSWHLHLDSIQKIASIFSFELSFFYAKSCQLYLQDMINLENIMDPLEYDAFTPQGYFTIRKSDKFWSGIWSDMAIEQTLMRSMKSLDGLTHGRGIYDCVLNLWTLGMVYLHNVCNEIENFTSGLSSTTEQRVNIRTSRISRNNEDLKKLTE